MMVFSRNGIYCPVADLYVDPWSPVERAVITHGHSDHARSGHSRYLAHLLSVPILKHRLGARISVQGIDYGTVVEHNGVRISLHPAGHIVGSAQVRVEHRGEVWVVSGDYKLENDGISQPFESIRCDVFVTESTFGLPLYRWQRQRQIYDEINSWWLENQKLGRASLLACYALGKAQRVLAHLDRSIGPIFAHKTIDSMTRLLREKTASLPEPTCLQEDMSHAELQRGIVLLPTSASDASSLRRFHPYALGYASGWMIAQRARRRDIDQGFVLSDHADWNGLNAAIKGTGAQRIFVTHGYSGPFVRWLRESGYDAAETSDRS